MTNLTHGRDQIGFMRLETLFGETPGSASVDPFVAADAIPFKLMTGNAAPEQIPVDEKDNARTKRQPVQGQIPATWNGEGLYHGSGTNNVAPDIADILEAALGTETVGGSDVTYSLLRENEKTLAGIFTHEDTRNQHKLVQGAIVEELILRSTGEGLLEWAASGPAQRVIDCFRTAAQGTFTAGDTVLTIDNPFRLDVGSLVSVASAGGELMLVTANGGSGDIGVTRGYGVSAAAAIGSGDALIPFVPSSSTVSTAQPIAGVRGSVTIDSVNYQITGFNINHKNNHEVADNEYGTEVIQGVAAVGERDIRLGLDFRFRRPFADVVQKGGKFLELQNIVIVCGTVAGNILTINMPKGIIPMPAIDPGEREIVAVSGEFQATHDTDDSELSVVTT